MHFTFVTAHFYITLVISCIQPSSLSQLWFERTVGAKFSEGVIFIPFLHATYDIRCKMEVLNFAKINLFITLTFLASIEGRIWSTKNDPGFENVRFTYFKRPNYDVSPISFIPLNSFGSAISLYKIPKIKFCIQNDSTLIVNSTVQYTNTPINEVESVFRNGVDLLKYTLKYYSNYLDLTFTILNPEYQDVFWSNCHVNFSFVNELSIVSSGYYDYNYPRNEIKILNQDHLPFVLITFFHEIGHLLGLDHNEDLSIVGNGIGQLLYEIDVARLYFLHGRRSTKSSLFLKPQFNLNEYMWYGPNIHSSNVIFENGKSKYKI